MIEQDDYTALLQDDEDKAELDCGCVIWRIGKERFGDDSIALRFCPAHDAVKVERTESPCPYGTTDPDECGTIRERSVAGRSNTIPDCPVHGQHPDEVSVYAVKVNGEEYHHVASDLEALKALVGDPDLSYGQCQNCGGFGTLYSTSEEPKGFSIQPALPNAGTYHAVCGGCGLRYAVVLKRSKEVCF